MIGSAPKKAPSVTQSPFCLSQRYGENYNKIQPIPNLTTWGTLGPGRPGICFVETINVYESTKMHLIEVSCFGHFEWSEAVLLMSSQTSVRHLKQKEGDSLCEIGDRCVIFGILFSLAVRDKQAFVPVRHVYIITGWQHHQPFSTQLTGLHHHHFEKTKTSWNENVHNFGRFFASFRFIVTIHIRCPWCIFCSHQLSSAMSTDWSWDVSASQHLWDRNSYPKRSPKQWPGEERPSREILCSFMSHFYPKFLPFKLVVNWWFGGWFEKGFRNWKFFGKYMCDQGVL